MGASRGIAGSVEPEVEGIFLATDFEAGLFTQMNNTGGDVDVWAVHDVDDDVLVETPQGFVYFPGAISADNVTLIATDVPPGVRYRA